MKSNLNAIEYVLLYFIDNTGNLKNNRPVSVKATNMEKLKKNM